MLHTFKTRVFLANTVGKALSFSFAMEFFSRSFLKMGVKADDRLSKDSVTPLKWGVTRVVYLRF